MNKTNDRPLAVLNGLIEATLDSAYGYREAAGDARNPAFKRLFEGRWLHRKQLTGDLQTQVRGLGGTPDADGIQASLPVGAPISHRLEMKHVSDRELGRRRSARQRGADRRAQCEHGS